MNVRLLQVSVFVCFLFSIRLNSQCATGTVHMNYFTSTSGAGTYDDPAMGNIEYGFCFTLQTFYESQTNWVHGIFVAWNHIPDGVKICQGLTGAQPTQHGSRAWIWVDSLKARQFSLPGIGYYVDDGDGNPTTNYGDNGLGTPNATFPGLSPFCFIAKYTCGLPSIHKPWVTITGDGTTGGWKNPACPGDIIKATTGGPFNDGTIVVCGLVLPLELISFEGVHRDGFNQLKWTGIADNAFSHYELEKRGSNSGSFYVIQNFSIPNSAKENQPHTIDFIDSEIDNQITYYRLKLVEKNKNFEYSKIIAMVGSNLKIYEQASVFPIPTQHFINVGFPNSKNGVPYHIELISINGKILQSFELNIKGNSQIHTIPVSHLQAGVYFIKIVDEQEETKIYKFVKD